MSSLFNHSSQVFKTFIIWRKRQKILLKKIILINVNILNCFQIKNAYIE